jgi:phage N-6-adenine-methyltransferase
MVGRRLRQLSRSQRLARRWDIEPKDFWRTPPGVFSALDREFRFGLDAAAADAIDAKVERYLTPAQDALTCRWRDFCHPDRPAAFCNPPYSRKGGRGRGLLAWVEAGLRARDDGLTVVFVVPPAPSTQYHRLLHQECPDRRIYDGRLSFIHPDTGVPVSGNRGDTMVAVLRPGLIGPATPSYTERPPC